MNFRDVIRESDIEAVRQITLSTGFFRMDEVEVAVELIIEAFNKGQEESGYHFIFFQEEEKPAGFVCYGPIPCTQGTFDLYWVVVDAKNQNKGIGKQLLLKTEQTITMNSGRKLYIETSSTERYKPTRQFYLKSGYLEEARLRDFYMPGDDKVIYSKYL